MSAATLATLQQLGSSKISKFPVCYLEGDNWIWIAQMTDAEPVMVLRRTGLHKEKNSAY